MTTAEDQYQSIRDFATNFSRDVFIIGNNHYYGFLQETFEQRSNELLKTSQQFFELHSEIMDDTCKLEIKCWQFWLLGFILGLNLTLDIENTRCGDLTFMAEETIFMTIFFDNIWLLGVQHKDGGYKDTYKERGNELLRLSKAYLYESYTELTPMQILSIKCRQMYIVAFLTSQNIEIAKENTVSPSFLR